MNPRWYLGRLRAMDAGEVLWRARNAALQRAWWGRRGEAWRPTPATPRWAGGSLPDGVTGAAAGLQALRTLADAVHAGSWTALAARANLAGPDPDWFRDPLTSRRAPSETYCFDVRYRDAAAVGNVKHLWEVSRLHHVTLLAAAYHQTGEPRHAERATAHLRSWWRANPPLCGIHWVSGIELGVRLLGWVWARRLMAGHPDVAEIFERDALFQRQLHAHQTWLATFRSRGSSANNHLLAEMAGLLAASLAFPLFRESACWAALAAGELERECVRQTFPDGLNRELAAAYHVLAAELLLVAGCEADVAGAPMSDTFWRGLRSMTDALAATVDARLRTARQGDGDDGRAVLLDVPDRAATEVVLEAGALILGAAPWWPPLRTGGLASALLAAVAQPHAPGGGRAPSRPNHFAAAGISILRDHQPGKDEIWCRFDHGPHGFLATAAHAHADALSFELRLGGREILVDPGTCCYHDEPAWRGYFRSTIAHNALELRGRDQAVPAGPFLWLTHPAARLIAARGLDEGRMAEVEACHDAYRDRRTGATHRRRLILDRSARSLEVLDAIEGPEPLPARLAFTLHPEVACDLDGHVAELSWIDEGRRRRATLTLPADLRWSGHRGEVEPILGWYSPGFGRREPATTLLGAGLLAPGQVLRSRIALPLAVPALRASERAQAPEAR